MRPRQAVEVRDVAGQCADGLQNAQVNKNSGMPKGNNRQEASIWGQRERRPFIERLPAQSSYGGQINALLAGIFSDNVGWSAGSDRFAYATSEGIYVSDLQAGSVEEVITRQNVGLSDRDLGGLFSGIFTPMWSPDEDTLLFSHGTPDWAYDDTGRRDEYLFAIKTDGYDYKALARYFLKAVAPGNSKAVVNDWNPSTKSEILLLIDIVWD